MLSKLEETIIKYSQEEKEYMVQLDRMSKIDLILYINNLNNTAISNTFSGHLYAVASPDSSITIIPPFLPGSIPIYLLFER